jgi:hypothetical protein
MNDQYEQRRNRNRRYEENMFCRHRCSYASLNGTQTDSCDVGDRVIVRGIYNPLFRNCQTTTKALANAIVPIENRVENFAFPWDATATLQAVIWGSLTIAAVCAGGYTMWYLLTKTASAIKELEAIMTLSAPRLEEFISLLAKDWGPEAVKFWEQVRQHREFPFSCAEVIRDLDTIYAVIRQTVVWSATAAVAWFGHNAVQTNSKRSEWFLKRIQQWFSDKARRAHASSVPM